MIDAKLRYSANHLMISTPVGLYTGSSHWVCCERARREMERAQRHYSPQEQTPIQRLRSGVKLCDKRSFGGRYARSYRALQGLSIKSHISYKLVTSNFFYNTPAHYAMTHSRHVYTCIVFVSGWQNRSSSCQSEWPLSSPGATAGSWSTRE